MVTSASKLRVVLSALVLPDDRVGVHWVVVDNASPALHAALSWRITFQRAPGCSVGLSASSTCPSLQVWPHVVALKPFQSERNLQFTGDAVFFHDHL